MPRIRLGSTTPSPAPAPATTPAAPKAPPAPPSEPLAARPEEESVDRKLGEKSGRHFYSAFLAYPKKVFFQGEEENENIILLLRQHPITTAPWIVVAIILLLVPLFLFPALFMFDILPPLPAGLKLTGTLFWYLGTGTYVLLNFLYWYFNVYIITNENVVDVDWYSLTYRRIVSAPMSRIQDTGVAQASVMESVFDYGNVHVETAGETENIEFERIPHPAIVKQKIDELMQQEEKQWEVRSDN